MDTDLGVTTHTSRDSDRKANVCKMSGKRIVVNPSQTSTRLAGPTCVDFTRTERVISAAMPEGALKQALTLTLTLTQIISRVTDFRFTLGVPQSSVTCNGEYRRHIIEAQLSFHHVEHGGFVEYLGEWCHRFYAQAYRLARRSR